MTRRPDDGDGEGEDDPAAVERPRRRRRAGGLRIPSDNVPRHSGSQPVVAPVPEEPSLAVSIAYAFGDDASQPRLRVELDPDDTTAIGARPDGASPPPFDDDEPDGRTRQMPAMNLEALGLTAEDDPFTTTHVGPPEPPPASDAIPEAVDVNLDDDDGDGSTGESPPVAMIPVAPPRRDPVPVALAPVLTAAAAGPITDELPGALSEDDLEELVDVAATSPTTDEAPRRFHATLPARSISGASGTEPLGERTTMPMPAVTPADEASVIVSFSAPARPAMAPTFTAAPLMPIAATAAATAATFTAPVPAIPAMPAIPPVPTTIPMAAVAPIVAPPPMPAVAAAPPMPSAAPAPMPTPPLTSVVVDASVVEPHSESLSDGWDLPVHDAQGEAEVFGLSTSDALLEDVIEPVHGSDSGEILAAELLDDEELARAAAVTSIAQAPGAPAPPPAPIRPPPAPVVPRPPTPPVVRSAPVATAAASDAEVDGKKKRRGRPWFEEVFDEDYLRTLPYLTPAATQAEARMVMAALELTTGASVLDLGCGYGRHAMELAARGLHVVGLDLSLPLLLRGADEAQRRGLDINFVHADMREIDFDAQFDGAYCLFSTFGYFDDDTNKKVATQLGKALKPGGRLVLQVLNRDYVISDLPTRVWWEGDGCVVLEEVDFNYFSSRIQSKRSVVFDDGRQVEQEISIRAYSLHELGKLLHAAGLRVVEVSGGMVTRGRFLGNRAREIIIIADRPK